MSQRTLATPTPDSSHDHEAAPSSEVIDEVIRALRQIRFGSIEITIHESRVVQIECREKRRFELQRRA
jgi:hypothetical protein